MTTISAKIIADSVADVGSSRSGTAKRITTMQLRYPRFIHAEFMTHRQFSRNASSSRAIPVAKMIEDIKRDPAMPIYWGKNQKGMQASEECNESVGPWNREAAWEAAMYSAIDAAQTFNDAGYHKQVVNRLLEPFMHINVVVTSTEWSNFFALRDHEDAEPHIAHLARNMKMAMLFSVPRLLLPEQWHTPYMDGDMLEACLAANAVSASDGIKISVARCARVSYLTHEGKTPTVEEDFALYDQLVGSHPLHASPAEHQATPDPYGENRSQWGNFSYWKQHRKTLPGECQ